jgi:hypothetical protein
LWYRENVKHGGVAVFQCDKFNRVFREHDWWYYTYMREFPFKVCRAKRHVGGNQDMPPLGDGKWTTYGATNSVPDPHTVPERVEILTAIAFTALDPPTRVVEIKGELASHFCAAVCLFLCCIVQCVLAYAFLRCGARAQHQVHERGQS